MFKLVFNAISKLVFGLILVGLLIFPAAGTFKFYNGWLFIGILFVPMAILGTVLAIKAPEFLKKRLKSKEKEKSQKVVILISALLFLSSFVLSGLDFRFGWSQMPVVVIIAGAVTFLVAYGLNVEVMRENAYLSRVVEIQDNQKVVDTGLYGVVRHPMYAAVNLLYLSMPFVLGSFFAIIPMLFLPFVLIFRIKNEEKVLVDGLPGYKDYKKKVRYRLIPFIW